MGLGLPEGLHLMWLTQYSACSTGIQSTVSDSISEGYRTLDALSVPN
jgi:hypothetical protein